MATEDCIYIYIASEITGNLRTPLINLDTTSCVFNINANGSHNGCAYGQLVVQCENNIQNMCCAPSAPQLHVTVYKKLFVFVPYVFLNFRLDVWP